MLITTDTPISPRTKTVIGEKLEKRAEICAVVEATKFEGMSIVGMMFSFSAELKR